MPPTSLSITLSEKFNVMRIIAGKHRGRVLKEFDGYDIRPTSDRAREALFNIFATKIPDCSFLDLFAGTGAVGIEAISRGAKTVVMVDKRRESIDIIKTNLATVKENATVINTDAIDYLEGLKVKFDFIFVDPPYCSDLGFKALEIIARRGLLKKDGVVVFESDKECPEVDNLDKISVRRYGKNVFNVFVGGNYEDD